MARTVATLKVESLLGFDTTTYGSYVDNWLKDAVTEIANRANGAGQSGRTGFGNLAFAANIARVAYGLTLPEYAIVPFSVQWIDSSGNANELQWMEPEAYTEVMPVASTLGAADVVGSPAYYSIFTGGFWLYPAPSSAITVRYLSILSNYADSFTGTQALGQLGYLSEYFADTIVCYVRSKLFRYEDDFQMAQSWEQSYERNLAKVAAVYNARAARGQPPRQVPGMWSRADLKTQGVL